MQFAAGGEFTKPFDARFLKWRQFRPEKAAKRYSEPDDIFAYLPSMRKSRRAATNWVDGLYVPKYIATGGGGGGPVALVRVMDSPRCPPPALAGYPGSVRASVQN